IAWGRGASGDEALVQFVAARIEDAEDERSGDGARLQALRAELDGAHGEEHQNGVFGDMADFAKDEVELVERLRGHSVRHPGLDQVENLYEETVGVDRSAGRGRPAEDERHPEQQRADIEQAESGAECHRAAYLSGSGSDRAARRRACDAVAWRENRL